MIALLSPAKDLDMSPPAAPVQGVTRPRFLEDSERLVTRLRTLSSGRLSKLMDLSAKLAELNRQRFQDWSLPFTPENAKAAALAFNGQVYKGLNAASLTARDLAFAQQHVRILSGLYGLLRPLDLMQAYRLEMGCGFSLGRGAKDLYAFWGERITATINEDLETQGADTVINLSSGEYFKSVQPEALKARVITPVFKDRSPGGYKMITLFAKHQRGRMCRWIIEHRTAVAEDLRRYDADGYRFNADLSTEGEWAFTRDAR